MATLRTLQIGSRIRRVGGGVRSRLGETAEIKPKTRVKFSGLTDTWCNNIVACVDGGEVNALHFTNRVKIVDAHEGVV